MRNPFQMSELFLRTDVFKCVLKPLFRTTPSDSADTLYRLKLTWIGIALWCTTQCAYTNEISSTESNLLVFRMMVYALGDEPAYEIDVYRDGSVDYTGTRNVRTAGRVRFQVGPKSVERLVSEFIEAGYLNLNNTYRAEEGYADRNQKAVLFELITPDAKKSVVFYQMGVSESQKKMSELFEIARFNIPTERFRCPYVLPLTDRNAGYEVCSGKQLFTLDEMKKREGVKR